MAVKTSAEVRNALFKIANESSGEWLTIWDLLDLVERKVSKRYSRNLSMRSLCMVVREFPVERDLGKNIFRFLKPVSQDIPVVEV